MRSILWITHKTGISQGSKDALQSLLASVGLNLNQIFFITFEKEASEADLHAAMTQYQPAVVVCQDFEIAFDLGKPVMAKQSRTGEKVTNKLRGSVYDVNGIKVIILPLFSQLFNRVYGRWLFLNDLSKVARWFNGQPNAEPKFRYWVVKDAKELYPIEQFLGRCDLISCDLETPHGTVGCIGFSGYWRGGVYTFIIPFVNPLKEGNLHWRHFEDHINAWHTVKRILGNNVPKVFQNGNFDNSFLLKHRIVVNNWLFDTYHMWHCMYQDIPKSIDFICSIVLDNYKYWKDEAKGDVTEEIGHQKYNIVGNTEEEIERYWRYCGLDNHNTLLACKRILFMMIQLEYPIFNYFVEMNVVRGPALFSTMHGFAIDKMEQSRLQAELRNIAKTKLKEIHTMAGTPEFNPNSPQQVAHFIYNVLGAPKEFAAKKTREKKTDTLSTSKIVLARIADEHPLFNFVISRILGYKEAQNNINKYATVNKPYSRFYWRANAGGTKTWRQATNRHHFNTGTNAQNIPSEMRTQFVADNGWVLFDFDFSQSDFYYIAHESQDPLMIETAVNDLDTHLQHAERFFKIPYDEMLRGYKAKEDFYANPRHGIRQLTKHITHAATGGIGGYTMYTMYMGKENATKAAEIMGRKGMQHWTLDDFVRFCDELLQIYYSYYHVTKTWREQNSLAILENNRNLSRIGSGMTRKIFGHVKKGSYEHRDLLMWHGQGGTSYAINKTLNDWFYTDYIDKNKLQIFLQNHDNVIGKVREDSLNELAKLVKLMEQPIVIHDREFHVPAEGEIGYVWGKNTMVDWYDGITLEEVQAKASRPKAFDFKQLNV